jgi:hypothetical protein
MGRDQGSEAVNLSEKQENFFVRQGFNACMNG